MTTQSNYFLKGKLFPTHKAPIIPQKDHFLATFWGVRGTLPTPTPDRLKYGGNTSCVEVESVYKGKRTQIIFDAGTGIVNAGEHALSKGIRKFHILLSHQHYDHIMGLTKFSPLFMKNTEIHIHMQEKDGEDCLSLLDRFFRKPFFPLELRDLPAFPRIRFHCIQAGNPIRIENFYIETMPLHHPQESLAFRAWNHDRTRSVVYATDHEHGTPSDMMLVKFIQGTDLFIFDSSYSDAGYQQRKGFGHSTSETGAKIAKNAGAKAYGIFHHAPESTDTFLEEVILPEASRFFDRSFLSTEATSLHIDLLE